MGDMADFALYCACDDCEEYDDFMSGRFSSQEAYERGLVNEFGGESRGAKGWNTLFSTCTPLSREHPSPKQTLKCNKCGSTDVMWDQYPSGTWFLFDFKGKPHKCKEVQ